MTFTVGELPGSLASIGKQMNIFPGKFSSIFSQFPVNIKAFQYFGFHDFHFFFPGQKNENQSSKKVGFSSLEIKNLIFLMYQLPYIVVACSENLVVHRENMIFFSRLSPVVEIPSQGSLSSKK